MEILRKKGIKFEGGKQTVREIARLNGITPQKLYELMKPGLGEDRGTTVLPLKPSPGFAKDSLVEICQKYCLDLSKILYILSRNGIEARSEMNLKAIAEKNGVNPKDVYYFIRGASKRQGD